MQLMVDGQLQTFLPLRAFCETYHLPSSFSVALFEPKDYTGLGSIERAGAALNGLRAELIAALPEAQPLPAWLAWLPQLAQTFHERLTAINAHVGLREEEIGFAVSGLADVCHAWVYALLRAHLSGADIPAFSTVYRDWLNGTVRVSQTVHTYPYNQDTIWRVQVITHAYGRAGLVIDTGTRFHYVADAALACPAEGFMLNLLTELAAGIAQRIR
ncbi:hypothetical protein FBR02_01435 [Anaerolineae bacterium CFX9]|nr:hypothetical protein [Oscillatoria laete-virens]MDL1899415.1 hypothetical protein [Anaerolineae bacterium CFX9]MDL5052884.1 hypothetical protein [Oscillatoria laete-virens NRMC-F 0139]